MKNLILAGRAEKVKSKEVRMGPLVEESARPT